MAGKVETLSDRKPKRAYYGRRNLVDSWVHQALEFARKYEHAPRSQIAVHAKIATAYLQARDAALKEAEDVAREWARRFCSNDSDAFVMAGPARICGEIINGIHALRTPPVDAARARQGRP